jgi:rRNA maturation endonuclease Nob1
MPRFNQPCNGCGVLNLNGPLCETCSAERKRKREQSRLRSPERTARKSRLYNYAYRQAAKRIRETATHCHICGVIFVEGDRVEADHIIPGMIDGPLAAAHRQCNQRRGNKPL